MASLGIRSTISVTLIIDPDVGSWMPQQTIKHKPHTFYLFLFHVNDNKANGPQMIATLMQGLWIR